MNVYLIRHGETFGNKGGFHQGWGNVALTDDGIAQAETLGRFLDSRKIKFDRIICSDIHRAKQTAGIVFENFDIAREYDARLREINNCVFEGILGSELREKYGATYTEHCKRLDYSEYGGESAQSMLDRAGGFLSDLERDTTSEEIAVLTHGGTIHAFLSLILKMPLYMPLLKTHNCSVTKIAFDGSNWCVEYMNLRIDHQF